MLPLGGVSEAAVLAQVPLFASLAPADLDNLARRLRRRRYARGEAIFLEGDPGTSLCIVQSGRVKIGFTSAEGRSFVLDLFGPGDFFGELALLSGEPRSADAAAVEPTELLLLHRDEFLRALEEQPHLAIELLAVLAHRLRRDARIVQDATFLDVPARLAATILRLARSSPGQAEPGRPTTPRLTQSDLAGMVGTTRETLNKWLGFYEQQGVIRWDKGQITVLDAERLRQRAS
jgi:CRP/FNR family transcriptional regulator, cyclic AMP receptor protein